MFSINGTLYRVCTLIYNFALLNLLFLISCIPVVTIFPASAALFGVVRQWVKNNEISIFKSYWAYFAENFKQSFFIGIFYMIGGLCLYTDLRIVGHMQWSIKTFLFICLVVLSFYFVLSLVYLFPMMVNSYYTIKQLFANAFKMSIYKPHLTIINLVALAAITYLSLKFSFLLVFFTGSICAYVTYWFAERKFLSLMTQVETKIEKTNNSIEEIESLPL